MDQQGRQVFPELHKVDDHGRKVKPARGEIPSPHSFRHALASLLLNSGESAEGVSSMLGHLTANVTRAVYLHEVADARRKAMRRERLTEASKSVVDAYQSTSDRKPTDEPPSRM